MTYNQSSNPALKGFEYVHHTPSNTNHMTAEGAYNKSLILLLLVLISGYFGWNNISGQFFMPLFFITLIVGLIIALTLGFKPLWAPVLAPIYAIVEGFFLGAVSVFFETLYPGIVFQSIMLTIVVALLMNFLYRSGIIKVTKKFTAILITATFSVFGVYMLSIILNLFGIQIPYIHSSGPIGIAFSLVVVTIASLNLILDYHFIEEHSKKSMPKAMEWYGGFILLVTLVWLYFEILKLLSKLRGRD